jgi:hypothetical protein
VWKEKENFLHQKMVLPVQVWNEEIPKEWIKLTRDGRRDDKILMCGGQDEGKLLQLPKTKEKQKHFLVIYSQHFMSRNEHVSICLKS